MSDAPPRPVPLPDDASAPFWEGCARHELTLQRCDDCETFRYPPRPGCPRCGSLASSWHPASGRGEIWSWVVAHKPVLPAFAGRVPYNVVVVELEEGVRMIGQMPGTRSDDIRAGMPVVVEFEDVEDGVSLPQWRPV